MPRCRLLQSLGLSFFRFIWARTTSSATPSSPFLSSPSSISRFSLTIHTWRIEARESTARWKTILEQVSTKIHTCCKRASFFVVRRKSSLPLCNYASMQFRRFSWASADAYKVVGTHCSKLSWTRKMIVIIRRRTNLCLCLCLCVEQQRRDASIPFHGFCCSFFPSSCCHCSKERYQSVCITFVLVWYL